MFKLKRRGGVWYVRGTVGPAHSRKSVYESTGTSDRTRAEAYRARREAEAWDSSFHGDRAVVTFAHAAASYAEQRQPRERDRTSLAKLVAHFGARTMLKDVGQAAIDRAIAALYPDAAPATKLRAVIIPVTAVLNHAARRGWCQPPKFERPAQPRGRTAWLTPGQAKALLDATAGHLRPLLLFYLCTGARASEALDLQWSDVDLTAATCVFRDTKTGRDRIARLPPAAVIALANLKHRDGHVFRRPGRKAVPLGAPYASKDRDEGGQFKTAFRGACRRAGLVDAEGRPIITPHGLRHTWATWFQAVTRDPLRLKHEGGWASLSMVERYAHLAPSSIVREVEAFWGIRAQSVHAVSEAG